MSADIKDLLWMRIGAMQHLHDTGWAKYSFAISMVKGNAWILPLGQYQVYQAFNGYTHDNDND
jgi:hypothetical protein